MDNTADKLPVKNIALLVYPDDASPDSVHIWKKGDEHVTLEQKQAIQKILSSPHNIHSDPSIEADADDSFEPLALEQELEQFQEKADSMVITEPDPDQAVLHFEHTDIDITDANLDLPTSATDEMHYVDPHITSIQSPLNEGSSVYETLQKISIASSDMETSMTIGSDQLVQADRDIGSENHKAVQETAVNRYTDNMSGSTIPSGSKHLIVSSENLNTGEQRDTAKMHFMQYQPEKNQNLTEHMETDQEQLLDQSLNSQSNSANSKSYSEFQFKPVNVVNLVHPKPKKRSRRSVVNNPMRKMSHSITEPFQPQIQALDSMNTTPKNYIFRPFTSEYDMSGPTIPSGSKHLVVSSENLHTKRQKNIAKMDFVQYQPERNQNLTEHMETDQELQDQSLNNQSNSALSESYSELRFNPVNVVNSARKPQNESHQSVVNSPLNSKYDTLIFHSVNSIPEKPQSITETFQTQSWVSDGMKATSKNYIFRPFTSEHDSPVSLSQRYTDVKFQPVNQVTKNQRFKRPLEITEVLTTGSSRLEKCQTVEISKNEISSLPRLAVVLEDPDICQPKTLKKLGFVFHKIEKLIICPSCGDMVNLTKVDSHFTDKTRMIRDVNAPGVGLKAISNTHSFSGEVTKDMELKIVEELIESGAIKSRDDILYQKSGYIPLNRSKPIIGLSLEWGLTACPDPQCPIALNTYNSYRIHVSTLHPQYKHVQQETLCYAQTLRKNRSVTWFKVDVPQQYFDTIATANRAPTLSDFMQKKAQHLSGTAAIQFPSIPLLVPFLSESGIDHFAKGYDWKIFKKQISLQNIDGKYKRAYSKLQDIHQKSYECDIKKAADMSSVIANKLTNFSNSPFSPLGFSVQKNKSTLNSYRSMEKEFVWALYKSFNGSANLSPFVFTNTQKDAICELADLLNQKTGSEDIAPLTKLLDVIYFPSNTNNLVDSIFNSPLIAFISSKCFQPNGEYLGPPDMASITNVLTKLQFGIRLRGYSKVCRDHPNATDSDFDDMISAYLQDCDIVPFSILRYFMRGFTSHALSQPRPTIVWWLTNAVKVGEYVIPIPEYRNSISKEIQCIKGLIEKHILSGICTLSEAVDKYNLLDFSATKQTQGLKYLHNPETHPIFVDLNTTHKFLNTESNEFDELKCTQWLFQVGYIWSKLYPICHITQGPPGRGTEEALFHLFDIENNSSNLGFSEEHKTGYFKCTYQKTSMLSDKESSFARYLPAIVFLELAFMIEIKPIEVFIVSKLTSQSLSSVASNYAQHLFTTFGQPWTSQIMSEYLKLFFMNTFQVPMGLRHYRHLSVACSNKVLELENDGLEEERSNLKKIAQLLHQPELHNHKAFEKLNKNSLIIAVSRKWHKWFYLETSFGSHTTRQLEQTVEVSESPLLFTQSKSNLMNPKQFQLKGKKPQQRKQIKRPSFDSDSEQSLSSAFETESEALWNSEDSEYEKQSIEDDSSEDWLHNNNNIGHNSNIANITGMRIVTKFDDNLSEIPGCKLKVEWKNKDNPSWVDSHSIKLENNILVKKQVDNLFLDVLLDILRVNTTNEKIWKHLASVAHITGVRQGLEAHIELKVQWKEKDNHVWLMLDSFFGLLVYILSMNTENSIVLSHLPKLTSITDMRQESLDGTLHTIYKVQWEEKEEQTWLPSNNWLLSEYVDEIEVFEQIVHLTSLDLCFPMLVDLPLSSLEDENIVNSHTRYLGKRLI